MARSKSPSGSSGDLSLTGSRPTHVWVALVSYCFGFALFGCEVTVLGPTLTALARQVHVAEVDLSPLFTTLGLTTIIGGMAPHINKFMSAVKMHGLHHATYAYSSPTAAHGNVQVFHRDGWLAEFRAMSSSWCRCCFRYDCGMNTVRSGSP
jgi:hypothetical protein